MKKSFLISLMFVSSLNLIAQQATIIDSKSTTVPRYADLAAIQAAITSPQVGMMVYNIGTQTNWNYNGTSWINSAGAGASQWNTNGTNIFYNAAGLNNSVLSFSNNTAYGIPDYNPIGVHSTINIPNAGYIGNQNSVTISMNLNHTFSGDLKVTLIAPDASQIVLINRLGATTSTAFGWGADFVVNNTISFNNIASGQIQNIDPIPSGVYLPSCGSFYTSGDLNSLFNKQISGEWKLFVQDYSGGDSGSLQSWTITFGVNSITSGGRVGIGTTEPVASLSVVGSLQLLNGSQGVGKVLSSDANGFATWQSIASQWTTNGSNINYSIGNVGIGNATPNAPLQFSNSIINRKVVLYEGGINDHQYYGFGINGGVLRYQVDAINANHVFYAAANSTTSIELFRIRGTGNVAMAGKIENEAFQDLPLANGWVNFGDPYETAQFYKDKEGRVHLKGVIKNPNTPGTGDAITGLPVGYRPPNSKVLIFNVSSSIAGRVDISGADGVIRFATGSNSYISLDGISFRAE